jgi:hypothetical protein
MIKAALVTLVVVALGAAAFLLVSRTTGSPREAFARKVVRALAANNWEHSALGSFLCDNKILKEMYDRDTASHPFADYPGYGAIKATGKVRLTPPVSFPEIAMDTFVPVLFDKLWVPYPSMPGHIAYHAAYIQLATQESSPGQWCLTGWGHNDFPVDPDHADDFLNYQGIYAAN